MAKPAWNRSRSSSKARRRASPWFKRVRAAALAEVLDGPFPVFTVGQPLVLEVTYWLERPASHYRTGKFAGELKRAAPAFPTSKPDLTNLTKGLEDVLADWPHGSFALVYQGDQQIVDHVTRKRWATSDDRPGARVLVREVFEEPC
jgi:Holliday junction resolvase RusA-like endonuclease